MSGTYEHYLSDLGSLLAENAREAIREFQGSAGSDSADFKSGYMMAFHRVITLMQQQADAFQIPRDSIGLSDIDESEFFRGPLGAVTFPPKRSHSE